MPTSPSIFMRFVLLLSLVGCLAATAEASHYRGASATWEVLADGRVRVTVTSLWRTGFGAIGASNVIFRIYRAPNQGSFASNMVPISHAMVGTGSEYPPSSSTDFTIYKTVWESTLPATSYGVATGGFLYLNWRSCCWVSGLHNGTEASWQVEVKVPVLAPASWPHEGPKIAAATIDTIYKGLPWQQSLDASDAEGPVSCTLVEMPGSQTSSSIPYYPTDLIPGLTLNPTTGVLNMSAASTGDPGLFPGRWRYTAFCTDSDGGTAQRDVLVNVVTAVPNNAPVLANIGPKTTAVGTPLSFSVSGTDPNAGQQITVRARNLPPGATMPDQTGPHSGVASLFSWTPLAGQEGTYDVFFEVFDNFTGAPLADVEIVTMTVTGTNNPPILDPIGNKSVANGGTLTFNFPGADPDAGQTVTFSGFPLMGATVTDGGPPAAPTHGVFSWTPTPAQYNSTFFVTLTVTDDGVPNLSDDETIAITVGAGNSPPMVSAPSSIAAVVGCPISFAVAATDPDTGHTVTLQPGTGGLPAGASFPTTSGTPTTMSTFSWTPSPSDGGQTFVVNFLADDSGSPTLQGTASTTIVVSATDAVPPTIACPGNIGMNNTAGACTAPVSYTVNFSDNCPGAVLAQTAGLPSGSSFPVGTTTNTFVVTDAAGLTATCSFDVTVTDNEPPTVTCPVDIVQGNDPGDCGAIVSFSASTSDNCSGETVVCSPASGTFFSVGTTVVTCTVTDMSGLTATCTFNVTVNDTESPNVNCPTANVTANNDPGQCGAIVTFSASTSDNCTGDSISCSPASGSFFAVGTTSVTCTATDASGNTATCSFDVTVTDDENPVITCPTDITVNNDPGLCSAVVSFSVTATDNCSAVVAQTGGLGSGAAFPVGTTTVSYSATDPAGNSVSCSFTVTVLDAENPVMSGCSPITVNTDPGSCTAQVFWPVPTAVDNCDGALTPTSPNSPGDTFPVGSSFVKYFVTDSAGNSIFCAIKIDVVDNDGPVISGCPADITVGTDPGECTGNVSWTAPTASDNCGVQSLTSTHDPGALFSLGTTSVSYMATDVNGNSAMCSFTVTVIDTEAPALSPCPADITATAASWACSAPASWTPPTATDNCSTATITSTHAPGQLFLTGTTAVTYTATDAAGNTSICTFNVTVISDFTQIARYPIGLDPSDVQLIDLGPGIGGGAPDGHLDIVTVSELTNDVTIRYNDGQGGFIQTEIIALSLTSVQPGVVVHGGDLLPGPELDLAVAIRDRDEVIFIHNTGTGFLPLPPIDLQATLGLQGPIALDSCQVNGAGPEDLIVAANGTGAPGTAGLAMMLDAGPPLLLPQPAPSCDFDRPVDLCATDLDGDGICDLAVIQQPGTSGCPENLLLYQGGGGSFAPAPNHLLLPPDPFSMCCGDLDGGGLDNDLAIICDPGSGLPAQVLHFMNDGAGTFAGGLFPPPFIQPTSPSPSGLACGDLEGDTLPPHLFPSQDLFIINNAPSLEDLSLMVSLDPAGPAYGSIVDLCDVAVDARAIAVGRLSNSAVPGGVSVPDIVMVDHATGELIVMHTRLKPLSTRFGEGCPGSGAAIPTISTSGLPIHGTTMDVLLGNALGFSPAVLGVSAGYVPVPPTPCFIYLQSPVLTLSTSTTGAGNAQISIPLPPFPFFNGAELFMQWAVFDPSGTYPGGLALSQGLRIRLAE